VSPDQPAAIVFSAEEGLVERTPTATNRSRLTLIPRDQGLYIPLRTCETSFPPELIRVIARTTPFAWLCDAIARHEDPDYVTAVLLRQLFSYFAPADFSGKRLLDFGCGSGASTFALAAALPRTEVIGVELDPALVEIGRNIAAHRRLGNVRFLTSPSGTSLPSGIDPFDFVMFSAVYEHLLPMERRSVMPLVWSVLAAPCSSTRLRTAISPTSTTARGCG
jgi:SAM-dependent methyltransferase